MSDRTESLLAELVELHRRQVAIAEEALAGQREALAGQRLAIERQQTALAWQRGRMRFVFVLIGIVLAAIILPYAYTWYRFLARP
jgi:hypothetical protein